MAENDINVQDITENDYSVQKSGEQIDYLLEKATTIDAMNSQLSYTSSIAVSTKSIVDKIHFGTVEKKVTTATAYIVVPLNLDFTPKQVIVTLRHDNITPNPYQTYCPHVYRYNKSYSVCIVMGKNDGQEIVNVPTGTYYVDYIAIE